jgi:hypothetical protein
MMVHKLVDNSAVTMDYWWVGGSAGDWAALQAVDSGNWWVLLKVSRLVDCLVVKKGSHSVDHSALCSDLSKAAL